MEASPIQDGAKWGSTFMNQDAQFTRQPMVSFERLLPGPIESVWDFLTDPRLLPAWFGDGTIEPSVGGKVSLMGGHIRGVVTQWEPPRRLAYTWNVFSSPDSKSPYPESYLNFVLEPQGGDVLMKLTHLPVLERFEKQNAMGWHTFLDLLEGAIRGESPKSREVYMRLNAERYGVDLSNLVR
jgi:uncharacterized protein YndB with AHSA1/START domain